MQTAKRIYERLLKVYGPQGWWPVTAPGAAAPSYSGGPRDDVQRVEVMVGAILTQNTAWKNVEAALAALHAEGVIDVRSLLDIKTARLAQLIRSSGYFNEKAKKLKALAAFIAAHPPAALMAMEVDTLRPLLLAVHGVGPETADSILLYALEKPIFVVDAYTKRIFSRLGRIPPGASYHETQSFFHRSLRPDVALFNEYHALIVAHGKDVCKATPRCDSCVLRQSCSYRKSDLRRGD